MLLEQGKLTTGLTGVVARLTDSVGASTDVYNIPLDMKTLCAHYEYSTMHYFSVFELSHWHTFNLFNCSIRSIVLICLLMTFMENKSRIQKE